MLLKRGISCIVASFVFANSPILVMLRCGKKIETILFYYPDLEVSLTNFDLLTNFEHK